MNPQKPSYYDTVKLTDEEVQDAILEYKKRKYHKDKFKDYWAEQENKKIRNRHVTNL